MTDQPTPETVRTGAHNDALLRLHITYAELDDARADVARLRTALEECLLHLRHAKDCATKDIMWSPCDCGMPDASKLAREALSTPAQ